MKIYITIEDRLDYSYCSEFEKLLNKLGAEFIGSYESRGYNTIIADVRCSEDVIEKIIQNIRDQVNTLEVATSMKFYCTLDSDARPVDINPILRRRLAEKEYEAVVYPSHSENGINYVGINIKNLNPLDAEEMNRFKQLMKQINGVNNLIFY